MLTALGTQILMSDRGIPAGWRHMHGYYGHTLKVVNDNGNWVYAQFHLISDQGNKFFTSEEASTKSPDWGQKDLYEAIERGEYVLTLFLIDSSSKMFTDLFS